MNYRRSRVPGATYFFTVNLADRQRTWLVDHIDLLRQAFSSVKQRHPFTLDAIVILPDHLHALWTLPPKDRDFATRWMLIKGHFSRGLPDFDTRGRSRRRKGERGIWQRRYWEHLIRDEDDFARHVDYIHYNPVKHGHVRCASAWAWSSIHQYQHRGLIPRNWGSQADSNDGQYGERLQDRP
jgi:putative transposase